MHYYIDGYNLLFRTARLRSSPLQQSRETLIAEIQKKSALLQMQITLVFDAAYQEENLSITHYRNMEIIYSSYLQTADDLILNILKELKNPRSCILVTSDNRLAWKARHLLVKTEKVEDFLQTFNRRYNKKLKDTSPTAPVLKPRLPHKIPTLSPSPLKSRQEEYEEIFNAEFEAFEKARKKSTKKEEKPPQKQLSDFDRWLQIFTENSDDIE